MKKLKTLLLIVLSFSLLLSCDSEDVLDGPVATFGITMTNSSRNQCNEAGINFTFLLTYPGSDRQESYTVNSGGTVDADNTTQFRNKQLLNVKMFVASSEEPISEANIEFNFDNRTEEELSTQGNVVRISYCHQANNANITWNFSY